MGVINQNRIKPGVYVHIVTGKYAKDVLPQGLPTRKTINGTTIINKEVLPTEEQMLRMCKAGFKNLKGITRYQADKLINIALKEYYNGHPLPWQLQALINKGIGKHMSVKERYIFLRNMKREEAEKYIYG